MGAVLRVTRTGARAIVALDASGRARTMRVREDGRIVDARAFELGGGLDEAVDAMRGPFWSCAAVAGGAGTETERARALVGTSGRFLVECEIGDFGARRRVLEDGRTAPALGPHTGYVRDVVVSRDGGDAWSCACNFAPRWRLGREGAFEPSGEVLTLFTGDILRLALCEWEETVTVFCGVADGTVRAFRRRRGDLRAEDLGVVGGDASTHRTRGRVSALCVVDDEWLVSGSHDGCVMTHDARSPSAPALARNEPLDGKVHDLLALADGRVLAAGEHGIAAYESATGRDGRLIMLDAAFRGVREPVRSLASVDSRIVVGTASGDVFTIEA